MNLSTRLATAAIIGCSGIFLQGCGDPCDSQTIYIGPGEKYTANYKNTHPAETGNHNSSSLRVAAVASSAEVAPEGRLGLTAIADGAINFSTFPNKSYGKFISQVTIAYNSLTGFIPSQSAAFSSSANLRQHHCRGDFTSGLSTTSRSTDCAPSYRTAMELRSARLFLCPR